MRVVLVSTYDLGRQPFGLASPAAWLRQAGHEVTLVDLAVEAFGDATIRRAQVIAFHIPMHTATRLALREVARVRRLNPAAALCFFGLYATVNASMLIGLGASAVLGGEFEQELLEFVEGLAAPVAGPPTAGGVVRAASAPHAAEAPEPRVVTGHAHLAFRAPDRAGLPGLERYAKLRDPDGRMRLVGATEASRGCKHRCRHCPIVPVYDGRFRVVPREVVLEDVRRQVEAGATHITFGDPDFWNGIGHALPLIRALHGEHPGLSYDVTIKIEHLLAHRGQLEVLRDTGCAFVTSAVESLDDAVLERLDKGHTRADFMTVVGAFRECGLALSPTFMPFTPWTTLPALRDLLDTLEAEGLAAAVAPVQLAIRLLIPAGSRLLELAEIRELVGPFDEQALVYPWRHPEPPIDALQGELFRLVEAGSAAGLSRLEQFRQLKRRVAGGAALRPRALHDEATPIPYLTEPWYC